MLITIRFDIRGDFYDILFNEEFGDFQKSAFFPPTHHKNFSVSRVLFVLDLFIKISLLTLTFNSTIFVIAPKQKQTLNKHPCK